MYLLSIFLLTTRVCFFDRVASCYFGSLSNVLYYFDQLYGKSMFFKNVSMEDRELMC